MKEKFAFLFPGQGSQYVGMGKDIYENYDICKQVFDIASNISGLDLVELCFQGPKEDLKDTAICQVAVFVVSIACLKALHKTLKDKEVDIVVTATAGLSLGEYAALVYSGIISFEDAVKLVHKRGQSMKEVTERIPGTMVGIIKLNEQEVQEICLSSGVDIANLNCPGQIVISGASEKVEKAVKLAKQKNAKVVPLRITGAYHSRLMAPARRELEKFIEKIEFSPPRVLFVSNITGNYHINPREIRDNLIVQVDSTVHWQKSMELMLDTGITRFLEIGPGKVLAGLLRRIDSAIGVNNIETTSDIIGFVDGGIK